jgi:hypothetical protein
MVLQTVLSVLAVWALLTVLAFALLLVRKALESARAHLQHIEMGVRAIDKQTQPMRDTPRAFARSLREAAELIGAVGLRLPRD